MIHRVASWSALLLIALSLSACCEPVYAKTHGEMLDSRLADWVAAGLAPERISEDVEPEYPGLIGRSVAVMVAADERTLFEYPRAPERICTYLANELEAEVRGIKLTSPTRISRFIRDNPDW